VLKKIIWFSLLLISLIGVIAFSAGFYQALSIAWQPARIQTDPVVRDSTAENRGLSSPQKSSAVNLLIMGDSIAKGTGDDTGKGLSLFLRDYLKNQTPKEILANAIGIDGLQISGLLELLQGEKMTPALAAADILLISIGGNDLRQLRRLNDMARDEGFQKAFDGYAVGLVSVLKMIRRINSDALVMVIGLYYPSVQDVSPDEVRLLLAWNEDTQKIIEQDRRAIFIPTYDLFKLNISKYLARDGLHPNASGYQAIAERIGKNIGGYLNGGQPSAQKNH